MLATLKATEYWWWYFCCGRRHITGYNSRML